MGCGCGGKSKVVQPIRPQASTSPQASTAVMYDVVGGDGTVALSSNNITFARAEARKIGGTVVPRSTALAAMQA